MDDIASASKRSQDTGYTTLHTGTCQKTSNTARFMINLPRLARTGISEQRKLWEQFVFLPVQPRAPGSNTYVCAENTPVCCEALQKTPLVKQAESQTRALCYTSYRDTAAKPCASHAPPSISTEPNHLLQQSKRKEEVGHVHV